MILLGTLANLIHPDGEGGPGSLASFAGYLIGSVWAISLLIGTIQHDWTALITVSPVMVIFAGSVFGVKVIQRQKNGNGEPQKVEKWSHLP